MLRKSIIVALACFMLLTCVAQSEDFFIWTATGTEDFAASGFAYQISSMVNQYRRTFHLANNEAEGNVSYRLYEGGTHGPEASNQYTFNALILFHVFTCIPIYDKIPVTAG